MKKKLRELSRLSQGDILEIGSRSGNSAEALAKNTSHTVYCIDLWDMLTPDRRKDAYTDPQNYKNFMRLVEKYPNIVPVKGDSKEIGKIWRIPLGLLFIDGDHSFEGAKSDYEYFSPYIIEGGFLAMHDYDMSGPRRVIDEIVTPSGLWADCEVAGRLFTARRVK